MSDGLKPFRKQHEEYQITRAIERALDKVKTEARLAKSGSGKPGGDAVTRRIDQPRKSATRYAAPDEPHFHIEMEHGTPVRVKVAGEEQIGKIEDWNEETGGVTVRTRAGRVRAKRHHLRPVTDDELARHREQDERDQELAGIVTTRYTTEDLRPGFRVVCLDGDDEVAGRIMSISHDRPAHVVIRGGQGMNGHGLRVFTVDRIVQVLEGDGR